MRADIFYPYALDPAGSIVNAAHAPRSDHYSCIACGERMVLKRGEIKRPHFAHYTENPNCKPETVLHMTAKNLIKAGLDTAIRMKSQYPFTWHCSVCDKAHKGDLARAPRDVKTEVNLDGVRPDILVSSVKGKPLVAIEVVVTHRPEQEAIEAYKKLKLPVLLVEPRWEDLEKFRNSLGMVEAWQAPCQAKRCPKCGGLMKDVVVGAFAGHKCDKCRKPVLDFGLVIGDSAYFPEWSRGMVKPARSVGVYIKRIPIGNYGKGVWVLKCPHCGYSDRIYCYEEPWFEDVVMQRQPIVNTRPYYRCETCDIWIEQKRAAKSMTAQKPLNIPPREKGASNE